MKITKEQLVNLIGESTYDNLKEMAQLRGLRRKHGHGQGQAGGEALHKNFTRIYINKEQREGEPKIVYGTLKKFKGDPRFEHVGWRLFEPDSDDIFFLDQREVDQFLNEMSVEVEQILQASGIEPRRVRWVNKTTSGEFGKLPKTDPRRPPFQTYAFPGSGAPEDEVVMAPDTRYKGKPITKQERPDVQAIPWVEKERYLRDTLNWQKEKKSGIYSIINEQLNTPDLIEHMAKCALPTIHPNEREFLDRHSEDNTNTNFEYTTHSIIYFATQQDFYTSMLSRIKEGVDISNIVNQDKHMRYQFNKRYNNYRPEKKTDEKPENLTYKTPIYKLDGKDYTELGLDVCVMGLLKIKGTMDGNNYTWSAQYVSKWGKKLRTAVRIEGGLKPDLDLSVVKQCEIVKEPDEPAFSQYHVITHNESISNCFKEVLSELKTKIMAVRPASGIAKAIPSQAQIDKTKPNPQNP